jgi:hypothetical protein
MLCVGGPKWKLSITATGYSPANFKDVCDVVILYCKGFNHLWEVKAMLTQLISSGYISVPGEMVLYKFAGNMEVAESGIWLGKRNDAKFELRE